jgi:ADP-ribosylglycohydrolase
VGFPLRDQFTGCLLGQCLGDALGFVVEGYPPQACRSYVDGLLRSGRAGEIGRSGFPFGQYSDDSQLARELLRSFADCGKFDPQDYGRRIAGLFTEGRIVGRGRATEQAAMRLARGVPWDRAGTPAPAAGNGSAMRAGPMGLLFGQDPRALLRAAVDQSRITHADPRCCAGAVAIAGAVALAAQPERIEPATLLATLSSWAEPVDASVARALRDLTGSLALGPEEAVRFVTTGAREPTYQDGWQGISPFVTESVLWSLYSFLRTPDDYWETICTAIAVGGDVDTTAAMAGAVSGARLGAACLPPALCDRLEDQGTWRAAELRDLAARCHALAAGQALCDW